MIYLMHMTVNLPRDMAPDTAADIKAREKAYAQQLQQSGQWKHLWRVVGEYANVSVFDVADHDSLHKLISELPLFPYMTIKVTPLAAHPSAI